jgi:hypothetical protein
MRRTLRVQRMALASARAPPGIEPTVARHEPLADRNGHRGASMRPVRIAHRAQAYENFELNEPEAALSGAGVTGRRGACIERGARNGAQIA